MQKLFLSSRFLGFLSSLLLFVAVSSQVWGDDGFALAVGPHDALVIFGPKGDKVAELSAPAISQPVTVGATSFQVSYGRDANDLLTAILTPSPSQPQSLHFNVLNKNVDTDKQAVVTLTFSPGQKHVTVDPGYVGLVHVNAQAVRHHELTNQDYAPQSAFRMTPATGSHTSPDIAPRDFTPPSSHLAPHASTTMASNSTMPDVTGGGGTEDASQPGSLPSTAVNLTPVTPQLSWPGPITPPNGPPPHVASNQMMLVEVQGDVTVKTSDGHTTPGTEGMLVPSGATVSTSDDSSAAVFMGGINSARLTPQSEVAITQNVKGSVRKTMIDLHKGTVFSRVGRREGETEDYKVHTPQGVAAAHGTEFGVGITTSDGVTYTTCSVIDGVVELTNDAGNTITITPESTGQVSIASIPALSLTDEIQVLTDILTILNQFNTNSNEVVTEFEDAVTNTITTLKGKGSGSNTAPPDLGPPPPPPPPPPGVLNNDANNTSPM